MQVEKRKREDDEGEADRKKGRARKEDGGVEVEVPADEEVEVPADEEVEEFFFMVRRRQVALEYFKKRNGRQITAASWIPLLEREDFGRKEGGNAKVGLDLNSDPVNEIEANNVPDSG